MIFSYAFGQFLMARTLSKIVFLFSDKLSDTFELKGDSLETP